MGIIYPGGGGGGTSSGLPEPFPGNAKKVVGNDGVSTALWVQLTADDLGTALSSTFVLSVGDSNNLVERGIELGDSVTSTPPSTPITGSSSNTPTGTVTSASIANTYTGATDAGDVDLGVWSTAATFITASAAGSVKRNAAGGTDPRMLCTRTYSNGGTSKTVSDSISWTYKVYAGVTATATPTESTIEGLAVYNSLKQNRTFTTLIGGVLAFAPSSQYIVIAFPDLSAWTTGTPTFIDQNGATFVMQDPYTTVSVTNTYGVTCNYRCYRSQDSFSVPFTVTVT